MFNFSFFVGFLNFRGIAGEFIVLVDGSRLATQIHTAKYYKIESLIFVPMIFFEKGDSRLVKKLDRFQQLLIEFGYYGVGCNITCNIIDKSKLGIKQERSSPTSS